MGVCIHYFAIPPQCHFYARLYVDAAFNTLLANLYNCGSGIFRISEIEQEELDEVFDHVMQRFPAVLGARAQAQGRIEDFLAELKRVRAVFPGIENRSAMLEKRSLEIEEALARTLQEVRPDDPNILSKLMFGDSSLAPHLLPPHLVPLGLLSVPVVLKGADLLRQIYSNQLFPGNDGWEEWSQDNYMRWRQVFLDAAENAEVILVGVST